MANINHNDESSKTLKGQAEIWKYMLCYTDSIALKCAVELRIADIINSHGSPISLSDIANDIPNTRSSPDTIPSLARIMRLLVRRNIFVAHRPSDGSEGPILYGLTDSSKWLLRDHEFNLAPMVEISTHSVFLDSYNCLSRCVTEGGTGFEKAHKLGLFEFCSENAEFGKLFNEAMACTARITVAAVLKEYKEGFEGLSSLVDVGGGTGSAISEIVRKNPNVKGINFDQPHVVAAAPVCPGVTHVGGDIFESVPNADAVFMKWILHDWCDEDCLKILRNCRKAIPEKTGKLIIVDIVLEEEQEGSGLFDDTAYWFDLGMIGITPSGKERTEKELKKLLNEGGFPRYNIIKIQALPSIIEAYPV